MADDYAFLWWWTAAELAALLGAGYLVALSLTGEPTTISFVPRALRLAALGFVAVELLIPLAVYLDLRRHPGPTGTFWVHMTAMPLLNLLGLVAYLVHRWTGDP